MTVYGAVPIDPTGSLKPRGKYKILYIYLHTRHSYLVLLLRSDRSLELPTRGTPAARRRERTRCRTSLKPPKGQSEWNHRLRT
jgi:hypothetical protein